MIKKKLLSVIGVAMLGALTACGGGSSSTPAVGGSGGAGGGTSATVSGSAVKGIISNGVVSIYGVTNGSRDSEPLITGTTDANGTYSLQVPDYSGPVVVVITAGDNTTMKCDIPAGCGAVAFGDDVDLDDDFSLKAVVPAVASGGTVSTNVTTLTSLAAERAEATGSISEESAQDANSQVASLFNITGSLTELPVVDLTSSASLAAANDQARQAAFMSVAILAESLKSNDKIGSALSSATSTFVNNSGQLVIKELTASNNITLEKIYAQALAIVESPQFANADLGVIKTQTKVRLEMAQSATPGELTKVEPSTPQEATAIAAAQALADSIRRAGLYQGATENTFLSELETALDLTNEDMALVVSSAALAIEAISAAMSESAAGSTYVYTPYDDRPSVTVAISGDNYSIDESVVIDEASVAIDVQATGTMSVISLGDTDINLESLTGTVETADTLMTIVEASQIINMSGVEGEMAVVGGINLVTEIKQLKGETPVTFTGRLSLDVGALTIASTEVSGSSLMTTSLDDLAFSLSGEFSQGTKKVSAILSLEVDLPDGVSFHTGDLESVLLKNGAVFIETDDAFVSGALAISFQFNLAGVDPTTLLELSLERTGAQSGAAAIGLTFNGDKLLAEITVEDNILAVAITDHNSNVMNLNEDPETGDITGDIMIGTTKAATISEENGLLVIRYSNGAVDSI